MKLVFNIPQEQQRICRSAASVYFVTNTSSRLGSYQLLFRKLPTTIQARTWSEEGSRLKSVKFVHFVHPVADEL